jgi:hypothetical protein
MPDRLRDTLPARLATALRMMFVLVCVVSLVLGYLGLRAYILARPSLQTSHSPGDLIYYDVELFLLQSPPIAQGGPYPLPLAIARFAAPCVSAYTIIEIGIALSAGRIRRARVRRYRGHAIVCGSTRMASVLSRRLREDRQRVVAIEPRSGDLGATDTIMGDPSLPKSLRDAGVERAAVVYACLEDSHRNVEVANSVERIRAGRPVPARIHALVQDLDLCLALKARRWSTAGSDRLHVDFFNPDELAAQRVVRLDEQLFAHGPPRVAIVGTGAFGRSALVELGRQWLVRRKESSEPLYAVLVGPDARQVMALMTARYSFLSDICLLETHTGALEDLLADRTRTGAPRLHRLYLCQEDEGEVLKSALDSVAHLQSALGVIVARLDRMSGMARTFDREPGSDALFDALGGRLRIVDVAEEACDPAVIGFDLAEVLARTGHQRYLLELLGSGAAWGSSAAMAGWENLDDDVRASNREQAIDIGRKMAAIGCLLVPRSAPGQDFCYRDEEVESLARQEHDRWRIERSGRGWRFGPARDDAAKRHPSLVPWARLPESEREKDREIIRAMPELLAEVGLAIVRVDSPVA